MEALSIKLGGVSLKTSTELETADGRLFVLSAASGTGKSSLIQAVMRHPFTPPVQLSISYTTRAIRPGEQNGVHYIFLNKSTFLKKIKEKEFLEYAEVFGHYYGTSLLWVQRQLAEGKDVLLEIDWQGAQQICTRIPHAITIFLLPPSLSVLAQRLKARETDPQLIQHRLSGAKEDISHCHEFDYCIVNDCFDKAVFDFQSVLNIYALKKQKNRKNSDPSFLNMY